MQSQCRYRWKTAGFVVLLLLAGCGTVPVPSGDRAGDPEPMYKVENRSGGFTISTVLVRHQADRKAVEAACRRGLVRNANDLAASLGRAIEPIDEQRIRVSMSAEPPGATTCKASVAAAWRQ
jgi:hypothetical protein